MKKTSLLKLFVILFCIAFLMVGMVSHANDALSELNSKQSELEQEKAKIQEELDAQKVALEQNQAAMAEIVKEQASLVDERDAMIMDLEHIFESIEVLDETIAEVEIEYENKLTLLKERAIVMYQNSNYSELQMFIEADNILEYINRKSFYDAMLEKDQQLIEEVLALKADLESKKAVQVENKANYEKLLEEKETLILQLNQQKSDLSVISESTQQMIEKLEAMEDEMAQQSENLAEKIRQEQERISKKNDEETKDKPVTPSIESASDKLLWPSAASRYISSYFGMRMHPIYNYMRMHNGIDIAAAGGTDILAAESGTVIISEWQTNGGYGQYVVIDHGNGMSTVYAHASKLIAKAGQQVERGDVIALVGNTGNSKGNHLHFEVRINGTPQNPINYL